MAQIRGVINQAHRNQELETIKNMYHSDSAGNIDNEENNNDKDIENENQQDDDENSDLDIIEVNEQVIRGGNWDTIITTWNKMLDAEENAERQMEHEDSLENNNNFGDDTFSA